METKTKQHLPNKVTRRKAREEARAATRERGEVTAIAKYVKISPQKTRIVVDAIRGKSATDAINILRFTPKKAAKEVIKVIESAVANAENNFQLDAESLYVYKACVDGGPMIRRFHSRAMGRAVPIRRRTSHITIVVKERGEGK